MVRITDGCFERLVCFIKANYGMDLANKRVLADSRLASTAASEGYHDLDSYIEDAMSPDNIRLRTQLVNRLTTNHTYFMREAEHFTFMFEKVLPYIESTVTDRDVRIWCAGCSTGQEAYSMSMVIDEYFGAARHRWDTTILATDINTDALITARNGIYPADAVDGLSEERVDRYFTRQPDGSYRINEDIRNSVVFKRFNLMDEIVYKKPFDLISCRNVMIYFSSETKDALVKRLCGCTKAGGYLFTGHAENLSRDCGYEYISPAIFRKPPEC
ncbi:MAG: protein-glutamate O-methyltransferase CheR [Oscillospiraceae bacterium]|nr:protein-glutamate O-methyltransferase CheR [Oscillospiraceae bacterium]